MSIFHSTVSRREFMKNLGLAGAGIGAASLVAPNFHDVDELMSSTAAIQKRPWFVKERAFLDPAVEHDWSSINRYDRRWQSQTTRIKSYFTETWNRRTAASEKGAAISAKRQAEQAPGYTLRTRMLHSANLHNFTWSKTWTGPVKSGSNSYTESKTPEELGLPKWTGTPEEASKMMNAAMRYYGSVLNGYAEFDQTWKDKVLVKYTTRGATKEWSSNNGALPSDTESLRYEFENVDKGYATSDGSKYVFPNKPLWIITTISPVASQFLKTPNAEAGYGSSFPGPNGTGGTLSSFVYGGTFRFLRSLGYECYSDTGHQSSPFNENMANQLTGINEQSRQQNYGLNAEYGNATYPTTFQTNLPLAPTPPVDAGMWKFCKTCGFCAINCPPGCIESHKEPTWEIPPYEGKEVTFHNKGIKAFWNNFILCQEYRSEASGCSQCWGYCTFSVDQAAMVHALVKQTISVTPLFNSFFATMGEVFGYGNMDSPEEWWDMSLPMMGIDTVKTAWKGR